MISMIRDRRGTAVLVVIWMTGVLAVMALGFAGRVREASQEVRTAEARLHATAAIDAELAQLVYRQLRTSQEEEEAQQARDDEKAAADGTGTDEASPTAGDSESFAEDDEGFGDSSAETDGFDAESDEIAPEDAGAGERSTMLAPKPVTITVEVGDVSLYLHAEPEMGRIDVNRGDPRVLRALLEKIADRGVAARAMEAAQAARERAGRAGAVIGMEPEPFVSLDAWLDAVGMDQATAERVRPYLTTFTGASKVDLALAPQEVIDVMPFLSRSQKERIAKARERSPETLIQVLAEIATDPSTDMEAGDGGGGEAPRQVMRVLVEATVKDVLRRTDQFVLAFQPESGGSGAGLEEEEQQQGMGLGRTDSDAEGQAPAPLPFVILDRQTLDAARPHAVASAATAPGTAP